MTHGSGSPELETTPRHDVVATLLERWQSDRDPAAFAAIVRLVTPPVERLVARTLRGHGIRDPGACDDAVALVIEQVYRLGVDADCRPATRYDASRATATVAPGWSFIRCIARSRAHDVARAVRRRDLLRANVRECRGPAREAAAGVGAADGEALRAGIARLDERSRTVLAMLLEGKTQAVIAHVLGVCEGTVSRIRARALERLREIVAAE